MRVFIKCAQRKGTENTNSSGSAIASLPKSSVFPVDARDVIRSKFHLPTETRRVKCPGVLVMLGEPSRAKQHETLPKKGHARVKTEGE